MSHILKQHSNLLEVHPPKQKILFTDLDYSRISHTQNNNKCHFEIDLGTIKMYSSFPFLQTVRTYKNKPEFFLSMVDKFLDYFTEIENIETQIALALVEFAQEVKSTLKYNDSTVLFRKCLKQLISEYKRQRRKFNTFCQNENDMDSSVHEEYLQTLAILEVIGHLILDLSSLRIGTRACNDCTPYFVDTRTCLAPVWSAKVVLCINLPEDDSNITFRFGRYDPVIRDFV